MMNSQNNQPNTIVSKEDEFVIVPTRKYIETSIEEHAKSRNHPDATLTEKGFVILSNVVDSDNEIYAATSKAVKTAYDQANIANQNAINANNNANARLEKKSEWRRHS
nr:phage tail protein [Xenorhabdus nematophila]